MAMRIQSCTDMSRIEGCEATECSYNDDRHCRTVAITVGDSEAPFCDTYFNGNRKGGVKSLTGGVGACRMDSCNFNEDLECSADPGISVSFKSGSARCNTYQKR